MSDGCRKQVCWKPFCRKHAESWKDAAAAEKTAIHPVTAVFAIITIRNITTI